MPKIDLVQWIKDNPGATFTVDNDAWWAFGPYDDPEGDAPVYDGMVKPRGAGYGSGPSYGGDILQALAELQGVTIESV